MNHKCVCRTAQATPGLLKTIWLWKLLYIAIHLGDLWQEFCQIPYLLALLRCHVGGCIIKHHSHQCTTEPPHCHWFRQQILDTKMDTWDKSSHKMKTSWSMFFQTSLHQRECQLKFKCHAIKRLIYPELVLN